MSEGDRDDSGRLKRCRPRIIYLPVAGHEFINFDDDLYVLDTPVQDGRALDALVRWGEAPAPMDDGGLSRGGTPGAGGAP